MRLISNDRSIAVVAGLRNRRYLRPADACDERAARAVISGQRDNSRRER